jgi:hypothetical protein
MRYQTAPRPVASASYRGGGPRLEDEAGDGNRTRTKSLEGSCATVTPRPRVTPMIGGWALAAATKAVEGRAEENEQRLLQLGRADRDLGSLGSLSAYALRELVGALLR